MNCQDNSPPPRGERGGDLRGIDDLQQEDDRDSNSLSPFDATPPGLEVFYGLIHLAIPTLPEHLSNCWHVASDPANDSGKAAA